jgi:hypothetical protein
MSTLESTGGVVVTTVLLALVFTSRALAQEDAHDEGLAPRIAQPCLNNSAIKRTQVLDGRNIVFVTRENEIYDNQLPRQCPSLRRNSVVNYAPVNGKLCAGNTFAVLWQTDANNYVPAFICPLGNFVPIDEDELADLTAMTDAGPGRRERRRNRDAIKAKPVELPRPAPATPTE